MFGTALPATSSLSYPDHANPSASRAGLIGLAPMEGVIDVTTRRLLCAKGGLDWVVTEFVRVVDQPLPARVFHRLCPELAQGAITPDATPVQLQLLGSNPAAMAENARIAVDCGAPALDINFGCPAKTVNRHGGGASMLKSPADIHATVAAVCRAVPHIPVSAKLRLGFEDRQLALQCADAAAQGGAHWLTLHARTRKEGYRPPAHWEWIARVRHHVNIPIVANGDIWTLEDYWQARALSGCRHVMIGRGLLSDPLLAARIRHWQRTGEHLPATQWTERAAVLCDFVTSLSDDLPEKIVLSLVKQWLSLMRQHDDESAKRFIYLRTLRHIDALLEALHSPTTP